MMVSGGFVMVRFQTLGMRNYPVQIYVLRYKWTLDLFQINFFCPFLHIVRRVHHIDIRNVWYHMISMNSDKNNFNLFNALN